MSVILQLDAEGASKKAQTIKMQHKDDGTEQDRNELKHLLDVFGDCITPLRSFIHNRQLIGNITSSICGDQSKFLYKLCSVAKDCKFSDSDDVIKLLFLINNKNAEVRSELLKVVKDTSTLDEYLDIACRVESVVEVEKLVKSTTSTMQSNVQIDSFRSQTRGWGRGAYHSGNRGDFQCKGRGKGQSRSSSHSLNCNDNACKYCGETHPPKLCPAYGMTCYKCNAKNHFSNVCRSGSDNRSTSHPRDFQKSHVKGKGKEKSQKKKVSEVLEDYDYDCDSEEEGYEIREIKVCTIHSCFQSHKEPRLNSAIAFKCNIVFDEMTSKSHTMVYKDLLVCTKNGINQQRICMKINIRVESNILPLRGFKKIFPDISVVELSKMVRPNTSSKTAKGNEIKQLGHCKINVCFADNRILCHFFVVPNYCHCILGLPDSERLEILTIHSDVVSDVIQP